MSEIKNTNLIPPAPAINTNSLRPFNKFCVSIGMLPSSYKTSLTYEEQLLWLCNYLEETVIPSVNNNGEAVAELQALYEELRNYVNDYFTNLDVQEEINKKLDEMAENGTLTNLIKNYVDPFIEAQNQALANAISEQNQILENQNQNISVINSKVNSATSGTPLGANSIENMTNTERIYVLSSTGHWYFYNGEEWQDGGVYQGVADYQAEMANKLAFETYKVLSNFAPTIIKGSNIGTSGSPSNKDNRARTDRHVSNEINKVLYLDSEIYQMSIAYYYSTNGTWINQFTSKTTGWTNKKYINTSMFPAFAIAFRRTDNEEISDEDITAIITSLKSFKLTDIYSEQENAPADAKQVGFIKNQTFNMFRAKNLSYNTSITIGEGIGDNTGSILQNPKRARTGRLNSITRGNIAVLNNPNYVMMPSYFSSNSETWEESFIYKNYIWANKHYMNMEPYCAFSFKRVDNADLTEEDKTAIQEALEFYFLTDKTLTIENAPADAKTVGDKLENVTINNLTASVSMFRKIGVVGASRERGYYYTEQNGQPIINENLSWCADLCRRNGAEPFVFAMQSITTREFLTNSNCLPKALASDPCNLYVICLGGNDASYLGMDYLGSIEDITEDYNDNPDTFYGNYARIIEQIKAHASKAKFIMAMVFYESVHASNEVRRAFWNATKEIAQYYGIPVLDWNDDPWTYSQEFLNGIVHSHPSVIQLSGIAISFEKLFSKVVNENMDYFIKYIE